MLFLLSLILDFRIYSSIIVSTPNKHSTMKFVKLLCGHIILVVHTATKSKKITAIQGYNLDSPHLAIKGYNVRQLDLSTIVTNHDVATHLTIHMNNGFYMGELRASKTTPTHKVTTLLKDLCKQLEISYVPCDPVLLRAQEEKESIQRGRARRRALTPRKQLKVA